MKKLLLCLLVLIGGVSGASASEVTLYFDPSTNTNWTSASARFALALYKDGIGPEWKSFEYNSTRNCYYVNYDTDTYNQFILCRMKPSSENNWDNKWNQTPTSGFKPLPTTDSYLFLTDTNWGDQYNEVGYNVSLLPWAYYFYGDLEGDNWKVYNRLVEENGTYSGTISDKTGKSFVIFKGEHINYENGYIWDSYSWDNAIRPNEMTNLGFGNVINSSTITGGSNNWTVNFDNIDFSINIGGATTWSCTPYFTRAISSEGYATFSSEYNVAIPEGVTASYATGVSEGTLTTANFTNGIAANTGALLYKAGGGEVSFTPATSTDDLSDKTNYFVAVSSNDTSVSQEADSKTNYILTNKTVDNANAPLRFYMVNENGNTVNAGKAYLSIPSAMASAREFFSLDEDITAISTSKANQRSTKSYYNMNGQRIAQPTKGIYIVNGKKIVIK